MLLVILLIRVGTELKSLKESEQPNGKLDLSTSEMSKSSLFRNFENLDFLSYH